MNKSRAYGLIGNPVKHSLSPLMHNAALARLKIKARYKLFPLEEKELQTFLANLKNKNIRGLNITIPYKETILRFIDAHQSSAVRVIGAANTLTIDKEGKPKLFNTDYLGFVRHMKELKVKPKRAGVIGAGGACRAICFALWKMKAQEVVIYDIDKFRSLSLMKNFNQVFTHTQVLAAGSMEELNLKDKDLLVNASPVGMKKDDPLLVSPAMLHPGLFIYDLIYNPQETKLLRLARENNLPYANGLGMLLYQGVEALDLWIAPKKAPVEVMRSALEKGVRKL
ncbi:MAG: shikimate dehydrogenase [Candidatus Omnitrophota bacterium]|jgi:shikimate dehydrogenase